MNLKLHIMLLIGLAIELFAQKPKVDWKTVQVFEFTSRDYPDSLEICAGEWFIKAEANSMKELDADELERIKKKVADHGCTVVYVDVRKVYTPRDGKLYILGLQKKEK